MKKASIGQQASAAFPAARKKKAASAKKTGSPNAKQVLSQADMSLGDFIEEINRQLSEFSHFKNDPLEKLISQKRLRDNWYIAAHGHGEIQTLKRVMSKQTNNVEALHWLFSIGVYPFDHATHNATIQEVFKAWAKNAENMKTVVSQLATFSDEALGSAIKASPGLRDIIANNVSPSTYIADEEKVKCFEKIAIFSKDGRLARLAISLQNLQELNAYKILTDTIESARTNEKNKLRQHVDKLLCPLLTIVRSEDLEAIDDAHLDVIISILDALDRWDHDAYNSAKSSIAEKSDAEVSENSALQKPTARYKYLSRKLSFAKTAHTFHSAAGLAHSTHQDQDRISDNLQLCGEKAAKQIMDYFSAENRYGASLKNRAKHWLELYKAVERNRPEQFELNSLQKVNSSSTLEFYHLCERAPGIRASLFRSEGGYRSVCQKIRHMRTREAVDSQQLTGDEARYEYATFVTQTQAQLLEALNVMRFRSNESNHQGGIASERLLQAYSASCSFENSGNIDSPQSRLNTALRYFSGRTATSLRKDKFLHFITVMKGLAFDASGASARWGQEVKKWNRLSALVEKKLNHALTENEKLEGLALVQEKSGQALEGLSEVERESESGKWTFLEGYFDGVSSQEKMELALNYLSSVREAAKNKSTGYAKSIYDSCERSLSACQGYTSRARQSSLFSALSPIYYEVKENKAAEYKSALTELLTSKHMGVNPLEVEAARFGCLDAFYDIKRQFSGEREVSASPTFSASG